MFNSPKRTPAAFDMEDTEEGTQLLASSKEARMQLRQQEQRRRNLLIVGSIAAALGALALMLGLSIGLRNRKLMYSCPPGFNANQADLAFFVVGDWGRSGNANQRKVSSMMGQLGGCYRPTFVVSTGDNFYHSGLTGPADPTFTQTFTSVYTDKSLMVPWYAVLGNHDYGELDSKQLRLCSSPTFSTCPAGCCYSPSWQTNMSHLDWRWNAHQGAWRRSFADGLLDIVFVDTTPFLTKYQDKPWANIAGGISSQDQAGQAKAVQVLMRNSTARWKVVVGHHPVRSYGEHCKGGKGGDCVDMQWLRPIMAQHQAAAYFSGHEHDLQVIKSKATASPPDPVYYVVSGAGSDIRDHDFSNVKQDTERETNFLAGKAGFVAVFIKGGRMTLHVWADGTFSPAYTVDIPLPQ